MGITFACIAPHGAKIISQLAGNEIEAFSKTRQGMEKIASLMKKQKIDTIIIATPHNLRLEGNIGIITTEFAEGSLRTDIGSIKMRVQCNRPLAKEVLRCAKECKLPIVGVNYGTDEGLSSCMPMDWGTLIPLWFFGTQLLRPRIVIVTPSREIPIENLEKLGSVIAQAAKKSSEKVAFVASADQAHTHDSKGPYGFHPASTKFDNLVKKAVKENNLGMLLHLEQQLIETAKPDSLWQIAILFGVLHEVPMRGKLISYQAPTYFGMLCAAYMPP
ncbi:MAG: extradiol ring-cleavage dioxygenase [Candidatus Bathyarchaeota archaeon]|nr:extradiol ring-cleavage dioxygenase [Candidatus Bathyarchaeota archaeon]MDH5495154.1 extradiol ring-cleavage dioxygenase [Candidatus Bathyarchaeota archaeon]